MGRKETYMWSVVVQVRLGQPHTASMTPRQSSKVDQFGCRKGG